MYADLLPISRISEYTGPRDSNISYSLTVPVGVANSKPRALGASAPGGWFFREELNE